jgi:VanZ family protein
MGMEMAVSKFLNWILVGIFLVGIIYFSQQQFYQQDISPIIEQNKRLVSAVQTLPPIEFTYHQRVINSHQDTVAFIHFMIRKMAHVFIYGCFGLSLLRALQPLAKSQLAIWILVGMVVLLLAGLDELNQFYSGGRTGCPQDILLDFSGYVLFSLVYFGIAGLGKGQRA